MLLQHRVLKLRQVDITEITRYLGDQRHQVAALKSRGFDPRIPSTDGSRDPITEEQMQAIKSLRETERIHQRVVRDGEGRVHWAIIEEVYGPKRMEHRLFYEDFGELAPLARFTQMARIRGERRFVKERLAHIGEIEKASRVDGPRRPGFPNWLVDADYPISAMAIAAKVLELDAKVPKEPSPEHLSRLANEALDIATRPLSRDGEFISAVRDEAEEMLVGAGHAYRCAKICVESAANKAFAEEEEESFPALPNLEAAFA